MSGKEMIMFMAECIFLERDYYGIEQVNLTATCTWFTLKGFEACVEIFSFLF